MKKLKPGAPHLPKLLRFSVLVRQAHIEDICGEYPVEKRYALCSTKTRLCACIVENEGLKRCRLRQRNTLSLLARDCLLECLNLARMYPLGVAWSSSRWFFYRAS